MRITVEWEAAKQIWRLLQDHTPFSDLMKGLPQEDYEEILGEWAEVVESVGRHRRQEEGLYRWVTGTLGTPLTGWDGPSKSGSSNGSSTAYSRPLCRVR